jgi:PilZ domain-containing protein
MRAVLPCFTLVQSMTGARVRTSENRGLSNPFGRERRASPRVDHPFPVTVRTVKAMGEALHVETVIDNMSARGLFVRLSRPIALGAPLTTVIRLSVDGREDACARVVARGVVRRVELKANGQYGIAVEFARHRVIYRHADR